MDESAEAIADKAVDFIGLTAEIVSAYMSKNPVRPADLPDLLAIVHAALAGLGSTGASAASTVEKPTPAQIRRSVTHVALISFEDGKPYKTLGRHLTIRGLTPEAYRVKWGLPRDYPMVAAGYSEQRSAMAKSLRLGQLRRKYVAPDTAAVEGTGSEKPKRSGRPRKAEAAKA